MPLHLPCWSSCRFKPRALLATAFLILAIFLAVLPVCAHAAPPAGRTSTLATTLVLSDQQEDYDVTPFLYHTRDAGGDLGTREVYLRHQNNLRGEHLPPGPVNLSLDPVPHWFVLDIVNNSHRSDWFLDIGALGQGRTGLTPVFYVQNAQTGNLLDSVNGNPYLGSNILPLGLLPGQSMSLVIYTVPSDHAPFVMAPHLVDSNAMLFGPDAKTDGWVKGTVMVTLAGCILFFMGGMFLRRGLGFFPHILYFIVLALWFFLAGNHVLANIPAGAHLQGIFMAAGALLALAATQSVVLSQEGEDGDSIVLYICASFVLLAVIVFVFATPAGSTLRLAIVGGATAAGYLVAIVKALTVRRELRWAGIFLALAWIVMLLALGLPYLDVLSSDILTPTLLQAPWLLMPLVCILMVLSGIGYIRAGNTLLVREVLRQAQRAQNLSKLKLSKETADQARLLRVIEREREIMEDLRAREAERTEEMRMAKISADEANRAKSAFLAVVSHEIRTPMTGIMGMVRLLLDTQMTREQRDFSQTIQDSGDAMLALLNDILDFSKIEGGGMSLEAIDFDLHRVIASVAMLMNGHAAQRGIYLQTNIDGDAPRYLKGDPTRLRQVLLNLVGNAIKFTPRGGVTITLRAGDPALASGDHADCLPVYCAVEDTGIGISDEAQKNLFNPFSQADSSIARKFGGTGLGLAICKRLIEAMGGNIELHSIEGQGSTFSFTLLLPAGDQQAASEAGQNDAAGAGNIAMPMHLLVVDDNAINRKVMEGLLGRDGHRVTSAASGADAIALLDRQPFDLVFMDIEMPDMNGMETTARIRANGDSRVAATPIVALTGNVGDDDRARYLAGGMLDTIAKPIDPEKLRQVLLRFGQPRTTAAPARTTQPAGSTWELSEDELNEDSFSGSVEYATRQTPAPDQTDAGATDAFAAQHDTPDGHPVAAPASFASLTMDPVLLDAGIFGSLVASLGEAQLHEMLAGVFAHNRTVLPTLQAAFNDGDSETLRGAAHELKGMNGNFGLKAISHAAGAIEKGCRSGELTFDQMDELVFGELPDAMARTEKLLVN